MTFYSIEVYRRGVWVPTDAQRVTYTEARDLLRSWGAMGCSARMIDATEGR